MLQLVLGAWLCIKTLQVVATGSCHSLEGLKLDQLAVRADKAMLMVQGDLLGPVQNARVQISDFPVEQLQPVFRCAENTTAQINYKAYLS